MSTSYRSPNGDVSLLQPLKRLEPSMLKVNSVAERKLSSASLLFFSIFILLGSLRASGAVSNSTYYPSDYRILSGTYLSGNVSTSLQTVDSDYFVVGSSGTVPLTKAYNPSGYSMLGNTTLVSGTTGDLVSDNGVYIAFRSFGNATSNQTLYAHEETTAIGTLTYYLQKLDSSDASGITLTANAGTTGRKLMGRFAYQLTGVSSISAGTWTFYYRAWRGSSVIAHCGVDILVRLANGTVRTTIATDVATSPDLPGSAPPTSSGTYSWTDYTVVQQTDYLEIDYYIDVTQARWGSFVNLRIDDNTLAVTDQTRVTDICFLNKNTTEIEFIGSSSMYNWTQLAWSVDSAWTAENLTVTMQLYNFTLGGYPTSGSGFISYTSSAIANTDETKAQTIIVNPKDFRDATGHWKIKVKGVTNLNTQSDFRADWIEFKPTYISENTVSSEFIFSSMTMNAPTQLNFSIVAEYTAVNVSVSIQTWNYSSLAYASSGQGFLKYVSSGVNDTILLSIGANQQFCTSNGNAKIQITGVGSTSVPFQQKINEIRLVYAYSPVTASDQAPFDWLRVLLYVGPVPIAILLVWFLGFKRKKKSKDHSPETTDTFSAQFGMTHEKMTGKKMLLEIDPTSDYHNILSSFVTEAKKADEPLFILTNKNSALHSTFSESINVNFLLLASKAAYPEQISEKETLLPGDDLSVVLDECVKIQKTETAKPMNMLLDHVSDLIVRCGFDRTYKFLRLLLEASSSSSATELFVFITSAHDQESSSLIRGLFSTQLAYTKNGPKVGNL